jgi:hypothetical protein
MSLTEAVELEELQARVRAAQRLVVLTGAGMSAESGIPTFRDAMTGLWSRFDPAALASEEGFRADPARVWAWYAERREGVRQAEPNAGHRALAPRTWTTCTNVPATPTPCACTATSWPTSGWTRARAAVARPATPTGRAPASHRTATNVATWCDRRWCGSARTCRSPR